MTFEVVAYQTITHNIECLTSVTVCDTVLHIDMEFLEQFIFSLRVRDNATRPAAERASEENTRRRGPLQNSSAQTSKISLHRLTYTAVTAHQCNG
jgi:hypothetical protein